MNNKYSFIGGQQGQWQVLEVRNILGSNLMPVERLNIVNDNVVKTPSNSLWTLRGCISNIRYAKRNELNTLRSVQPELNRLEAVCAVLIPIKKSGQWWEMAQDERRAIFEEQSHHTSVGLEYLPGVARQLYHCRDIGEPFDFLTWFEFAPQYIKAFAELLSRMRTSKEWEYVEREVEIHLQREDS